MTTACWGLLRRRERWGLSARGCLAAGAGFLLLGALAMFEVHPFLAVTHRQPTTCLAVEGWVDGHTLRIAKDEFFSGGYQLVFTTGGPVPGTDTTAAKLGEQRLVGAGVPAARVQSVPANAAERDRTYASAVALREALRARHVAIDAINVLTQDVHARRTRLLFQRAFGETVEVGIIAVPNPDYDARRWWRYSEGFREVVGETIAYVYAKFFFAPPSGRPRAASSLSSPPT